jgi:hypothetical protein
MWRGTVLFMYYNILAYLDHILNLARCVVTCYILLHITYIIELDYVEGSVLHAYESLRKNKFLLTNITILWFSLVVTQY